MANVLSPHFEPAYAKLNLTLQITGRRGDGYHELDSLVVFAEIADRVHATPADAWSLRITGPFAEGISNDNDNLVLRAATLLAQHAGIDSKAALILDKQLPVGAGLGGGSADAAATLRLLARLWNSEISAAQLAELALPLGADVPVCCHQTPMRMQGIGDVLTPVALSEQWWAVLVYPDMHVSTPAIFKQFARDQYGFEAEGSALSSITQEAVTAGTNSLQAVAAHMHPDIGAVLESIARQPGCWLARMSGSGSACFGLFTTKKAADDAAAFLSNNVPSYWTRSVAIRASDNA